MAPGLKTWHEIWAWMARSLKEARGILACTCLSKVHTEEYPAMWPYHNTWPSHVFMPGGWRKHQKMKPVRAKRRLNTTHPHMTSTIKPQSTSRKTRDHRRLCSYGGFPGTWQAGETNDRSPNKRQHGGKGRSNTCNSKGLLVTLEKCDLIT